MRSPGPFSDSLPTTNSLLCFSSRPRSVLPGTIGTLLGTLVAFKLLPLASLGADSWKIASALCARHIGGAVNYVSVSDALGMSGAALTAGLAADNLICAVYFTTLYAMARGIPAEGSAKEASSSGSEGAAASGSEPEPAGEDSRGSIQVLPGSAALALSAAICFVSDMIARHWLGAPSLTICVATAVTVALASLFQAQLQPLVKSAEGMSAILLQFFFASIGASGSVGEVVTKAPALFAFSFLQISVHLAFLFGTGKLLKLDQKDLIIGSNANVGGPTTAAGMAVAKGWKSIIIPSVLVGTLGYAIATFASVALGQYVLRGMAVGAV